MSDHGIRKRWVHVNRLERFFAKTERRENGCIVWKPVTRSDAYGQVAVDGRRYPAHRWIYLTTVGPIPGGLVLDHLCRERRCVNVEHLEVVTERVNLLRGVGASARNLVKTHCKNGHEFTEENTQRRKDGRYCRTCARYFARRGYQERRTRAENE